METQIARRIREDVRRVYLPAADDGIGVGIEKVDGNAGADRRTFGRPRADDGKGACRQFAVRLYVDIPRRFACFCLNVGTDDLCRCVLIDVSDGCRTCKRRIAARTGDVERDGVQLTLVDGVHGRHSALCEAYFRPADACSILLFLKSVVGDGTARRAAARGGGDSADGGILPRRIER